MRAEIVAHARADAPKEACGLIAGRDGAPVRVIRCANAHPAPVTRYVIDPREQLRAFRDMEANGEELVAIYHSHPLTQPYPSPTDRAEAHYPEAYYVLVSLRDPVPDVRAYRVRDGWVREVELA
ncbi:MAG TPA: M67 family metallopeptidase [Candidatus Limnocylindria bacterium]|nr:M67 family metallopeptidase [Candidatus Limnocylindria bacterium]